MNIYLISQSERKGYDTYDSAVVIAASKLEAGNMSPVDGKPIDWKTVKKWGACSGAWASNRRNVHTLLIGETKAKKPRLVLASFNAG